MPVNQPPPISAAELKRRESLVKGLAERFGFRGHECGHQVAVRNSTLKRWLHGELPVASEEVLASIIGSLLVFEVEDHNDLAMKAIHDVIRCGVKREKAKEVVMNLRSVLEAIL